MRILITGCSSYIGKYLVKKFLEKKQHKLYGVSRSNPKIFNKIFTWYKHDLAKSPLKKIKDIDIIIHIAGAAFRPENNFESYLKKNVFLAYNLGKTAQLLKPKVIFFTSSREVYGEILTKVLTEKNKIKNPKFYGQSKYMAEQILSGFCKTISLRLPSVLGKGTHGWISNVYKNMKINKKIKFINCKFNNFVYVEDVFKIINHFIEKKIFIDNQFNVSCSNVTSSEKVLKIMKKHLNSNSKIVKEKKH